MNVKFSIFLVALFILAPSSASDLSASDIVNKANTASYYAGNNGRSDARMRIVDSQGRAQLRQFVILRSNRNENAEQDFLVVFSRPSDVKNTGFLVHKKPQSDDDRWLYLPALDLVKRVSAGDKRTSFVGSHYYYEDVSGRNIELDQHELISSDEQFYNLKHTPKDLSSVEFAYYTTKVNKTSFLPMHIQYFDNANTLIREIEVLEVTDVKGYPTVVESKITDHRLGGFTLMQFRNMDYNLEIEQSIFSERTMKNPTGKWFSN